MAKILIVEDEAHCLYLLEITLKSEGFDVATARNSQEALERGRSFLPDVLISDWRLKDAIDGIEVARQLQNERPPMQVILFSGSPSDELHREAESAGLNVFVALEKPLGLDDVIDAIRRALTRPAHTAIHA